MNDTIIETNELLNLKYETPIIGIIGKRGSGKTWLAKELITKLHLDKVIAFTPTHNEYDKNIPKIEHIGTSDNDINKYQQAVELFKTYKNTKCGIILDDVFTTEYARENTIQLIKLINDCILNKICLIFIHQYVLSACMEIKRLYSLMGKSNDFPINLIGTERNRVSFNAYNYVFFEQENCMSNIDRIRETFIQFVDKHIVFKVFDCMQNYDVLYVDCKNSKFGKYKMAEKIQMYPETLIWYQEQIIKKMKLILSLNYLPRVLNEIIFDYDPIEQIYYD